MIDSPVERVGKMFRLLRKFKKRTLKDVAEETGLSVSFLSDMERGRTNPSLKTVIALAEYHGMRVEIKLRPDDDLSDQNKEEL